MAFTFVERKRSVVGDMVKVFGTFANGGADVGGAIKHGLKTVLHASASKAGAAVATNFPAFNNTFPITNGADLNLVTDADMDGTYTIEGLGY